MGKGKGERRKEKGRVNSPFKEVRGMFMT